jgi:hypothetical protein
MDFDASDALGDRRSAASTSLCDACSRRTRQRHSRRARAPVAHGDSRFRRESGRRPSAREDASTSSSAAVSIKTVASRCCCKFATAQVPGGGQLCGAHLLVGCSFASRPLSAVEAHSERSRTRAACSPYRRRYSRWRGSSGRVRGVRRVRGGGRPALLWAVSELAGPGDVGDGRCRPQDRARCTAHWRARATRPRAARRCGVRVAPAGSQLRRY